MHYIHALKWTAGHDLQLPCPGGREGKVLFCCTGELQWHALLCDACCTYRMTLCRLRVEMLGIFDLLKGECNHSPLYRVQLCIIHAGCSGAWPIVYEATCL